jgi:hypothetical protein
LTRHVNSELTNNYWNECIKCIRKFYPLKKIIVVDDNSTQEFVKAFYVYQNVEYVYSEFPQRGELLPYYYFLKNHYFDNAIIIHDSTFFKKRINFESFEFIKMCVLPIWHFTDLEIPENINNSLRLVSCLQNNNHVIKMFQDIINSQERLGLQINKKKWYGCFGVQSFINYNFLKHLQDKYNLFNLLNYVKNRSDRCCLERIMGSLFYLEYPPIRKTPSLLGYIVKYMKFGYSYNEYVEDMKKVTKSPIPVIKVWTGR